MRRVSYSTSWHVAVVSPGVTKLGSQAYGFLFYDSWPEEFFRQSWRLKIDLNGPANGTENRNPQGRQEG